MSIMIATHTVTTSSQVPTLLTPPFQSITKLGARYLVTNCLIVLPYCICILLIILRNLDMKFVGDSEVSSVV